MKAYPNIQIKHDGAVFTLYVNGEKYAKTYNLDVLSDCINEAIKEYMEA